MSAVPMITPNSITGISGLKERPVYFVSLQGFPSPTIAVKGEAAGQNLQGMNQNDAVISIAWSSKLMKNVQNSQANVKIMSPAEVQIFMAAAVDEFPPDSQQYRNASGAIQYNWVKMPYVANLSNANITTEKMVKGGTGTIKMEVVNMKLAKETIKKLSVDAVWLELGKVVAVDIFNGNGDRFNLQTGFCQNPGNIMFLTGGPASVIGLDMFDPNGGNRSNLNKHNTIEAFPALRTLIDPIKRKKFANDCARAVGTALRLELKTVPTLMLKTLGPNGPCLMPMATASLPDFFGGFAETFEQGLCQGTLALKTYLQGKVRQYLPARGQQAAPARGRFALGTQRTLAGPQPMPMAPQRPGGQAPQKHIPQGILDRMDFLGW